MIKKTCYFYNVGVLFDKNDKKDLYNNWNCNSLCCKSDLCNGLSCEDFGINFNKKDTINEIKKYVENGVVNTYGYMKKIDVELPEDLWNEIYDLLVKNYNYNSIKEASTGGFLCYEYGEIIDDFSSYWEEPDLSFVKTIDNKIATNSFHILKEEELNKNTIDWVNRKLYGIKEEKNKGEVELNV